MKSFWLNFHVGYACRHSGACCSSGWPIPVEHDCVIPIRALAGRADDQWLNRVTNAPPGVAGALAMQADGQCVFHGAGGCGVYAARPSSCSHFPFVCLVDARGVHVTLSHYCPTVASMLFDDGGPIAIVEGPPPVAGVEVPEGLDARESLPPLEAPDRLMTFEALSAWEREAVAAPGSEPSGLRMELFETARRAVPAPLAWLAAPDDLDRMWTERVAPSWPDFAPVVARYRAAKVFASWATYLGDGPATVLRLAGIADAVLKVEAVRQCIAAGRPLDAGLLTQAIRQADLLMVHYADARVLSSGSSS